MPLLLILLSALLLPPQLAAQDAPRPAEALRPLDLLLQQRSTLALTADQVARLESIRDRLAAANGPLVERMIALRAQWRQARRAEQAGHAGADARVRRIRRAADQVGLRIRRNNRLAMGEVNRLLSPAQRAQLREIIEERRRTPVEPPAAPR